MHAIADHVVHTDFIQTDIDAIEEEVFSPRPQTDIEASSCSKGKLSSYVVRWVRSPWPCSAWPPSTTT